MKEELIQFAWEKLRFDLSALKTTTGEVLHIIDQGRLNTNSGPDFENATILIDDVIWSGCVEIHVRAKDWVLHKHHHDPAYNNVILHVFLEDNGFIKRQDGSSVPGLCLKDRLEDDHLVNISHLIQNPNRIPCAPFASSISTELWEKTLEKALDQRLSRKKLEAVQALERANGDQDSLLFYLICRTMGSPLNEQPFVGFHQNIPMAIMRKYSDSLFDLEAMLFGTGGFLEQKAPEKEENRSYFNRLKSRYLWLGHLHRLLPNYFIEWKFARTRPGNFPSVRIAQTAALWGIHKEIRNAVTNRVSIDHLRGLLSVQSSEFWQFHYTFNGSKSQKPHSIGESLKDRLIINCMVPFCLALAYRKGVSEYEEYAKTLLAHTNAENNKVTRLFAESFPFPINAAQTQALLELCQKRCNFKLCLECEIGNTIINLQ